MVTPPAAAAWLAVAKVSLCSSPGSRELRAHVDEAGRQARAGAVEGLDALAAERRGAREVLAELGDDAVGDDHAAQRVHPARRVEQPRIDVGDGRAALSPGFAALWLHPRAPVFVRRLRVSMSRHAMRTATPISTCSWISAAVDVVGDLAVDLDAAVHRAGMHDQGVRLRHGELGAVEAVEVEILAGRRHELALHALGLQAQHHDDVAVARARRACRGTPRRQAARSRPASGSAARPRARGHPSR